MKLDEVGQIETHSNAKVGNVEWGRIPLQFGLSQNAKTYAFLQNILQLWY